MAKEFGGSEAGKKGGRARAVKLSADERKRIAQKAALKRWEKETPNNDIPRAICGSTDNPLVVGGVEIPCYVLDDETRVITFTGMQIALSMGLGGGETRLANYMGRIDPNSSNANELAVRLKSPLRFRKPGGGKPANGYEGELLADICDAILDARKHGRLTPQQLVIAERAEILVRGFARVGIAALIDEATGYQKYRSRQALSEILERYISDKMLDWAKRFPDEYYTELFRLKGWDYRKLKPGSNKPGVVGKYTRDIVYQRLAPGVIHELERQNPTVRPGQRSNKHHQWLTEDVGHPELREHLAKVITIMKLSNTWRDFKSNLRRVLPKQWEQHEFADLFPDHDD